MWLQPICRERCRAVVSWWMGLQGVLSNAFLMPWPPNWVGESSRWQGKEKRTLALMCLHMFVHYEFIMGSKFTDIDSLNRILIIKWFTEGRFQTASERLYLCACKHVDVGVLQHINANVWPSNLQSQCAGVFVFYIISHAPTSLQRKYTSEQTRLFFD